MDYGRTEGNFDLRLVNDQVREAYCPLLTPLVAGGEGLHSAEGVHSADNCQAGRGGGQRGEIYLRPSHLKRKEEEKEQKCKYLPLVSMSTDPLSCV